MNEETAKEKWCPMTRVPLTEGMSANTSISTRNDGDGYANLWAETRCQGTGCMMWRWTDHKRVDGHCGLAGNPAFD